MEPLLVRIFDVDFYMSTPVPNLDITFSQFRGCAVHQVPVIRVFGSTIQGKKICVHIHGVFPYFYVPYDGSEEANGLMYKIATNLDKAINISLSQGSSNTQHVYKVTLVSGIPFYGYHSKKHQFFKIYLYNPMLIKRVNNLIFNETVLGKLYQPHETHLNFTLQFMIDYNLHGMSNLILSEAKYRSEIGASQEIGIVETIQKVSFCDLECDVLGEHILNRQEIESGKLAANPGIAALWEDEKQRRRNKNEDSQIPHCLSLSKTNVPPTESHELFKRALKERLAILSQEVEKNEFNLSVYPAECPRNKSLLNCSYLDFHSPYNSQQSFTADSDLDQTFSDTLNLTLDQDVQDLIDVLKDLEKNVAVEEDSLLSQVSKNEDEDLEDDDSDLNKTVSEDLLDETIKISQICNENVSDNGSDDELRSKSDVEKSIKIPQLDGHCQDFDFKSLHSFQLSSCEVRLDRTEAEFYKKNLLKLNDNIKIKKIRSSRRKKSSKLTMRKRKKKQPSSKNIAYVENKKIVATNEENNLKMNLQRKLDELINQKYFGTSDNAKKTDVAISKSNSCVDQNKKNKNFDSELATNHRKIIYSYQSIKIKFSPLSNIISKSSSNLIDAILNKEHNYDCAETIGERVALKNKAKKGKERLKNQLKSCGNVAVVLPNIQNIKKSMKKLRDMPSLATDSFSSSEEEGKADKQMDTKITFKKVIKKEKINCYLSKTKKTIIRSKTKISQRGKTFSKLCMEKAQKMVLKNKHCLELLNKGSQPIFRIIPGYRPYKFDDVTINVKNELEKVNKSIQSNSHMKSLKEIIEAQKKNEITLFNSFNCLAENGIISDVKLLNHNAARIEKPLNKNEIFQRLPLFLDGANDSSDDEKSSKTSRSLRKKSKSIYSSLPISKRSSITAEKLMMNYQ